MCQEQQKKRSLHRSLGCYWSLKRFFFTYFKKTGWIFKISNKLNLRRSSRSTKDVIENEQ